MATESANNGQPWHEFFGPNLGYVTDAYEQYLTDPNAVDEELRDLFQRWGPPPTSMTSATGGVAEETERPVGEGNLEKVVAASKMAANIRIYGHLAANIAPLQKDYDGRLLNPEAYGLSEEDLRAIPARIIWENAPDDVRNGLEAIERLRDIYTKSLAYEFSHVHDVEERKWLDQMVETGSVNYKLSTEERVALLKRLTEVEGFEKFLHRTFVGQKRFSIEGVDAMVPMLDQLIREGVRAGARNVSIGMAHRGRLNVLAHILGKPYENIFSEFHHSPNKELVPSEGSMGINYGWTGDVSYHLGADRSYGENETNRARLTLANNPSHLEFVNPVVCGYTRAAQEDRHQAGEPSQDVSRAVAVVIHGDASFPGEGIVAETLNLSRLNGYQTGGTIHLIANNLLGFTTESQDGRSTRYASDLAKGFEIPIVHVNADDPEACLAAVHLAYQYRARFHKDFLIDLVGYRRFGHNEMDDPAATQPDLYEQINKHPTVKTIYANALQEEEIITAEQAEEMEQEVENRLQDVYDKMKRREGGIEELDPPETVVNGLPPIKTAVPAETLKDMNSNLLNWPEDFTVYPKLERILKRREKAFAEGGKVDWGHAEALAFASILKDGTPIRLTGQDTQRGTFAHRHLVLHDSESGELFSPLQDLPQANASFAIHNSPLSEASVLGFEYGYNVFAPETLVLWEAQFGDFANAAQVIFDQFISAGRAKWGQKSSLVMLLPHGYEGQGPEHSSARLERFLQLAAENNWSVANLTNAAQYFHVLRRQAAITGQEEARPLVIMTPKSLLRHTLASSPTELLSDGEFQPVLEQPGLGEHPDRVERLLLCSGKVAVDLTEGLQAEDHMPDRLQIVRVEKLYPFPKEAVANIIGRYENLKEIVWVQEEPRNMGAWTYMEPRLRELAPDHVGVDYIGRPERSSPATGEPNIHKKEQARIVAQALQTND